MQFIEYMGHTVATCIEGTTVLAPDLGDEPDVERFVLAMCRYAILVAEGELPGPFDQAEAEEFAREALMPDHEFAPLQYLPDAYLAAAFMAPPAEVERKRCDIAALNELGPGRWG